MKKIGVITMARNDNFFLERWIKYYGAQLGEENLFIYLDGKDQDAPNNPGKANIIFCDRIPGQIGSAEPGRLAFLSVEASKKLKDYDIIIGVDADEFLVVEPKLNKTLAEYLSEIKIGTTVSGLGFDVGQKLGEEKVIDGSKSFLSQRSYAIIDPDYTKPCVITKPITWGVGFHRIRGHNYKIDKNLYMFHFGCFDLKMLEDRILDKDRIAAGWSKHLQKRRRTIDIVTQKDFIENENLLPLARFIQTWFRPIYKWNRPSMLNLDLVIKIPERFKGVI
jgi:hypothetical protein